VGVEQDDADAQGVKDRLGVSVQGSTITGPGRSDFAGIA